MAALNQSKVKLFRRCQKQYAYRYDYAPAGRELIPKRKKLPLYRGSWMHALQQALHHQWAGIEEFEFPFGEGRGRIMLEGTSWEDVQEQLADQYDKLFDEEKEDLGDLPDECERLFKSYLRFWDKDQETYSVAEYKGEPMIEFLVERPLPQLGPENPFKGRIDLVVEDDEYGGLWIWDAKWVKSIPAPDERMMSPQSLMYFWVLREKYKLDVKGFVYNYGRTKPPTIPRVLKRPAGMLSTASKMDTDVYTYFQAIKDCHGKNWKKYVDYYTPKLEELKGREAMWFRRERIPIDPPAMNQALREFIVSGRQIADRPKPNVAPRSYFYNCKFGCDYHSLCVAEFQGLHVEPILKNQFEVVSERYGEEDEDLLSA
jgi:hypothetical protein